VDTTIADLTNSALQTPAELEKSRLIGYPSWTRKRRPTQQTGSLSALADLASKCEDSEPERVSGKRTSSPVNLSFDMRPGGSANLGF
jgi:hypothetical protein